MFMQWIAGCLAMALAQPFLFGTPFHHWMVYTAVFIGAAYGVALAQFHRRFSRRGADTARPGASASGTSRRL